MPTADDQPTSSAGVSHGFDVFENAAVAMMLVAVDGRLLRVNAAARDLFGRQEDDLLVATWEDLTHPDDLGSSKEHVDDLLAARKNRVDFHRRYLRPDGEVVTTRVTSALAAIDGQTVLFTQLHDVTDETAALAGVCAAEQRFHALTSSSSDAVYWLQLHPEVRFRFVNDAVVAMTGYAAEDLYAGPELRHRIVHPDDQHILDKMRDDPLGFNSARLRWVRRDGSIVWVEQRMSVLAEADGVVTDVLGVARDVTDVVEADTAAARHVAQRQAATELARLCASTVDPTVALEAAVAAIATHTDADIVAVWWQTVEDGPFRLAVGDGFTDLADGSLVDAVTSHAARVRAQGGFTSFDRDTDRTIGAELAAEGIECGIGLAIRVAGVAVGAVGVYSRTGHTPNPGDTLFLQAIANTLGACADRAQFDDQLRQAAAFDPLTGLLNRTALLDGLAHALRSAAGAVTLAVCDIDDFQLVNDAYGHAAGDDALRRVAAGLRDLFGTEAVIGRTGGDEFAIVIPTGTDASPGTHAARITAALSTGVASAAGSVPLTVTIGFSSGSPADDAEAVLGQALDALALAQRQGRSQWSDTSGPARADAIRRLELTTGLRDAVARGEIRAHFQPIVRLADSDIVGFEALARWERPDGVTVAPAEFIPIAEETGHIHDIGLSILDQACAFLQATHIDHGGPALMITVNVSPRQLDDPDLPARVEEVLARYAIVRPSICLELTESALVPGDQPMLTRLHNLRRLGITLAIDDFGTGYSSFAYLTQLPIDLLKLDRAFVTDLQDDPRRIAVVRSVVALARELGITVLAEGIETAPERDILVELDSELGQGYLWSRPVPPGEAAALLTRGPFEITASAAARHRGAASSRPRSTIEPAPAAGGSVALAERETETAAGPARVDRPAAPVTGDLPAAVLDATRELLWIQAPADAALTTLRLVADLGGTTTPARMNDVDALPVDIGFGQTEPTLPTAPMYSVARMLLERHLPSFMLDAQRALELADKTVRLALDASTDTLTGLANRRTLDRVLARLRPDDSVIMIDLDHFKAVNDTLGHPEGDRVLAALGRTLTATLRAGDHAGRYGGEEFVVVLAGGGDPDPFLERLRSAWEAVRPHPVTFSAGIAPARPDPATALRAADQALYRAKSSGRDQWHWATREDDA